MANMPNMLSPAAVPAMPPMAQTVRVYTCQCGQAIYFVNSQCLACGTPLGYDPAQGRLMSMAPGRCT